MGGKALPRAGADIGVFNGVGRGLTLLGVEQLPKLGVELVGFNGCGLGEPSIQSDGVLSDLRCKKRDDGFISNRDKPELELGIGLRHSDRGVLGTEDVDLMSIGLERLKTLFGRSSRSLENSGMLGVKTSSGALLERTRIGCFSGIVAISRQKKFQWAGKQNIRESIAAS